MEKKRGKKTSGFHLHHILPDSNESWRMFPIPVRRDRMITHSIRKNMFMEFRKPGFFIGLRRLSYKFRNIVLNPSANIIFDVCKILYIYICKLICHAKPGCIVFKYFRSNTITTGKELVLCRRCRVCRSTFRDPAGLSLCPHRVAAGIPRHYPGTQRPV